MEEAEQAGDATPERKEETGPGPKEETDPGPKEETGPGPKEETDPGPKEETGPGPKEETAPGSKEETAPGLKEETGPGPKEETSPAPKEGTSPAPKEETGPAPKKETGPAPKEETGPEPKEETGPEPKEETGPEPKEETGPEPKKETGPAPKEETGPAPQEETGPAPQEETGPEPKKETGPAPKEETGPAPKEETGPAPKEETGPAPKEETGPEPKEESTSTPQTEMNNGVLPDLTVDSPVTPQRNGGSVVVQGSNKSSASEKLQRVRKWSITTYKCTRQALAERMGRGSRTVDLDLEPRLELLKDDRQRYDHVTKLAQTLAAQITQLSVTQKALGDAFAEFSIKSPKLHTQFGLNAEAQRYLSKSGESLSTALNSFTSDLNTLVNKTIEDTMINAKQYEAVRIEYDAYRVDLEELNMGPRDPVTVPKLELAQSSFQEQRERYQRSRDDLTVKLKLLEENKVKVLHNQLWLLHNTLASHHLNCHRFLQNNMMQAQSSCSSMDDAPSWLEDS